jgi:hypothetical protein
MTTWLPEKFALDGRIVKVKDANGEWSDGWRVVSAGSIRIDEKQAMARSRDYTKQREASDIDRRRSKP